MQEIPVELGSRSYPVLIGRGARHELARVVPSTAKQAFVVTQAAVEKAGWLADLDPGLPFDVWAMPEGEASKTLATVEEPGPASPVPMWWWPWGAASSPTWPGSRRPRTTGGRHT